MMEQEEPPSSGMLAKLQGKMTQRFQQILDKLTPWILFRWIGTAVVVAIYFIRVFLLEGFYIVTYGIGIYILNLLIAFLSPQSNPETEGPTLPSDAKDEYKPFVRRLPEFKFWLGITKAFLTGFIMTFFPAFDIPVFWPILLFYWLMLLYLTMRKQIQHMIKYKYLPFSIGKKSYQGKNARGNIKVKDAQDLQGSAVATSVMPPKQLAKK